MRVNRDTAGLTLKAPIATYRVQLNKTFGFQDLKNILPYLSKLGISHIYASPIFQAKKDSAHGYDITDPNTISQELGGKTAFQELIKEASAFGLEWLQDIVPNHASYSLENKMIYDLMANGASSRYGGFFDVNWNYPSPKLRGKILAPFLARSLSECLKEGKLSLAFNDGFKIKYDGMGFPVNAEASENLLQNATIKQVVERYNNDPQLLGELLSTQYYALAHWRTALKHINYRRFFDIIDLIGLRMENPQAFEDTHRLIFELAKSGRFSGLRVDHIDGLYEPAVYLHKLRQHLPETYLIVEKILTDNEQLPASWSVQGTTGYDFLNYTNKAFIKQDSEQEITAFYRQFTGNTQAYSELLYDCKKYVIGTYFLGDVRNLARLITETLRKIRHELPYGRSKYGRSKLEEAVAELLSCFPIYRTYLNQRNHDDEVFRMALKLAQPKNPRLANEFSAIAHLLEQSRNSPDALHALMRFQQFTGAIMAKGFEDTALYRYSRLLSLNEVGSNPAQFGCSLQDFHEFNRLRQQNSPLTLNATSTHDTKRGEDVRARLNVLSEISGEFKDSVEIWAKLNTAKKRQIKGKLAPDQNEEYYLYQTLLGAFPWNPEREFTERIKQHMVKALREAKINSNWLTPNLPYEEAVTDFAAEVLGSEDFMKAFLPFQQKIAFYGFFNTLSQTLLKVTCPGIPDFYQGTDLWDLNLVDPDNRRPVNFKKRQELLSEISLLRPSQAPNLLETPSDGKAKLYVIYKTLTFRQKIKELFEAGAYIPLAVKGRYAENALAFCRKKGGAYIVVVVPRFLTGLLKPQEVWEKADVDWADTCISLPDGAPSSWSDIFTDRTLTSKSGNLPIRDALDGFPVALLYSGEIHG